MKKPYIETFREVESDFIYIDLLSFFIHPVYDEQIQKEKYYEKWEENTLILPFLVYVNK